MNINLPIELLIALAAILPYIPVWVTGAIIGLDGASIVYSKKTLFDNKKRTGSVDRESPSGAQAIIAAIANDRLILTWSYRVCVALFGDNRQGWMAVNLLIHGFNAVLFYWFVGLFASESMAILAGIGWGVNRLNTTAVITPSGRSSTLCSTFLMGMLVLAFSGHGIWATLSGACAMRTKQEGIVAPALLAGVAFVLWVRL